MTRNAEHTPSPQSVVVPKRGKGGAWILDGVTFGDLTVIGRHYGTARAREWLCVCVCGNTVTQASAQLVGGETVNCGCTRAARKSRTFLKHGCSQRTKEYRSWAHIKGRCTRPTDSDYPRYGGRGITMHPDWAASFEAFLAYIGPAPSAKHSVDRIDNSGSYVPGNVRWATRAEQARNTSRNIRIDGEALIDRCERDGLDYGAVCARIRRGHPIHIAISPLKGAAYRAFAGAAQ